METEVQFFHSLLQYAKLKSKKYSRYISFQMLHLCMCMAQSKKKKKKRGEISRRYLYSIYFRYFHLFNYYYEYNVFYKNIANIH